MVLRGLLVGFAAFWLLWWGLVMVGLAASAPWGIAVLALFWLGFGSMMWRRLKFLLPTTWRHTPADPKVRFWIATGLGLALGYGTMLLPFVQTSV